MSRGKGRSAAKSASAEEFDRAASALLAEVRERCDPELEFAVRVEAGVALVLERFAADRELAELMLSEPYRRWEISERGFASNRAFGDALRDSAASERDFPAPPFVIEPILIGAVRWQLEQSLVSGSDPRALQESLVSFLLVYYLDRPDERPS